MQKQVLSQIGMMIQMNMVPDLMIISPISLAQDYPEINQLIFMTHSVSHQKLCTAIKVV